VNIEGSATAALPSRERGRRAWATAIGVAAILGLMVATALWPVAAGLAVVTTGVVIAARRTSAMLRLGAAVGVVVGLFLVVLVVSVRPVFAPAVVPVAVALAAGWAFRRPLAARFRDSTTAVLRRVDIPVPTALPAVSVPVAAAPAIVCLAAAAAVWPVTTGLAAVVAVVVLAACRASPWALAAGVLLIGFEGSVKILLGLEPTPLPFSNRAIGAAAIDVALFAAIAGVVAADRGRTLRALWSAADRWERVVMWLLAAWFVISIVQIAQGGDLERGAHGFRLFQAYTLVALAAAVVVARPRIVRPAAVLLAVGLVVSLYAAVRAAIGPADAEQAFALEVESVTRYGDAFRAVGSFSSAVGMGSYLMPLSVFAFVIGLLIPRLRRAGWTVAGLSLVGIVASYGRTVLLGMAVGLLTMLVVLAFVRSIPARRKLAVAGLITALLACAYGGLWVASRDSPALEERAEGVVNPFGDESLRLRLNTWERTLGDVADRPLGSGLGSAGAASAAVRGTRRDLVTTDNSFLKVLLEQGIPVTVLFVSGLLGAVGLAARRLAGLSGDARAVGVAALSAFVAFLALAAMGEAVEQPGKVLAWAFFGTALSLAFLGRAADVSETDPSSRRP
jgi:hypothetical protein